MDSKEIDHALRKLIREENRKFTDHLNFLEQLFWSMIIFIALAILIWTIIQYKAARTYFKKKARQPRNDIVVHLDKNEEGEAQYLISIFTRHDYSDATTAITTIHLIGEAFPGRIHDISTLCKAKELYQMFAPLCTERIIVKEDIELEPIVGLTIKTNHYGMHPMWRCKTIVVRNLDTNDAWYFKLNKEIGFAESIQAQPAESLVTLNFSFLRRVRREYRNGQHIYIGFWSWAPASVYSTFQRVITSLVAHSCLICFCMVGLNIIFPLGYESTRGIFHNLTETEMKVKKNPSIKKFGWSFEGETFVTVWLYEIFLSAVLASFVTTFLGLVMVIHFRQQRIYERSLGEMDYVVATALRQISIAKRIKAARADIRIENAKKASKLTDFSTILPNGKSSSKVYPPRDSIFEPDSSEGLEDLDATPLELLALVSPAEARARQRILFIGENHLTDPRYAKFLNLPPIVVDWQPDGDDFLGSSLLAENYKRRYGSKLFNDGEEEEEEQPPQMMTTATDTAEDKVIVEQPPFDQHRPHSNTKARFYKEVYFRNRTNFQRANSGIPDMNPGFHVVVPELAMPSYRVGRKDEKYSTTTQDSSIPTGKHNLAKSPRPWYCPYSAWVITTVLMVTSISGTVVISLLGPGTNIHPTLYFLMLISTYALAVSLSYMAFEPIKIVIIAIFYAYNDRKLHANIKDKSIIPENIEFQYQH